MALLLLALPETDSPALVIVGAPASDMPKQEEALAEAAVR